MARVKVYKSEKDVKREVKRLLDKSGWFHWMPPANGFGRTGIADINALRAGVFLAIETKFGGNKPSPMQKAFLQSINAENGMAFIVDEKNIAAFERWMVLFDATTEKVQELGIVDGKPTPEQGAEMLDTIRTLTEMMV